MISEFNDIIDSELEFQIQEEMWMQVVPCSICGLHMCRGECVDECLWGDEL